MKVLIVDDDKPFSSMLKQMLERMGFDVTLAGNGNEALMMVKDQFFDRVFLDIIMPEKDGFETLIDFKQQMLKTKIIAMSGGTYHLDAELNLTVAKKFGVHATLSKPFTKSELQATLLSIMDD